MNRALEVAICRPFEKLNDSFVAVYFEHLAAPYIAVCANDVDKLVIFYSVHALDEHKGSDDFAYGFIFFKHLLPPG